ncbi:MAG: LCP family protein [Clostridiales Family XIII bacterium]|nr:LCP family protein [Clostridiales Family XIII bacterium]
MNDRPMDKGDVATQREREITEENMDVLIPGEGIFAADYADSKRVNVLLLGATDEGLADVIMLASFDPESKRADIISIPRDTYYERAGYSGSWLKINAVFHDGPEAMCQAVHNILLGIPINYYAVIDYNGVANIVDAIGGVPMDVPFYMSYRSEGITIDIPAGQQVLDGAHAVQFIRYRSGYDNGDIGRVEAQQKFVKSAAKQALGLNLPNVIKTVVANVNSDLTNRAIVYLGGKAVGMDSNNISTAMLPGTDGNIAGLSFWIRGEDYAIEQIVRAVYNGPPTATSEAAVEQEGE